jgi:hypothetical protein
MSKVVCFLSIALALSWGKTWADTPQTQPTTAPTQQQLREYWENAVSFWGDEQSGGWSLRLPDSMYRQRATFELLELWEFDRKQSKWVQTDEPRHTMQIVPPSRKPALSPPESQLLTWLEKIPRGYTSGLWYAKWRADGIDCATLIRIGNSKADNAAPKEVPPDTIVTILPLDPEHSQYKILPDPRIACVSKPRSAN